LCDISPSPTESFLGDAHRLRREAPVFIPPLVVAAPEGEDGYNNYEPFLCFGLAKRGGCRPDKYF
jgi:hypothetical protein